MGGEICTVNKCLGSEPKSKSGRSERLIHYEMVEEDVENSLSSSGQRQGRRGEGGAWSPKCLLVFNIYLIARTQRRLRFPLLPSRNPQSLSGSRAMDTWGILRKYDQI